VTVAKAIELSNRHENVGAQLIKKVASQTNDVAGDGTTTATILARAIFIEGCKAVAAGMNPMDIKRGIDLAVERVVEELDKASRSISSRAEIAQVATVSANNDKKIGELIATAFEKVGRDGVITVQDGKTLHDELEVVEGMKFDRGFISPFFMNNPKQQKAEYENPRILIVDGKISSIYPLLPILEQVLKAGQPLVIIAEEVEGDALATLVVNRVRAAAKILAIKAPGFGDNRKAVIQDIAILTGAQVISEELGIKLEEVTLDHLGLAKKVSASKDDTIILNGAGLPEAIAERKELIKSSIEGTTSDWEREKFKNDWQNCQVALQS